MRDGYRAWRHVRRLGDILGQAAVHVAPATLSRLAVICRDTCGRLKQFSRWSLAFWSTKQHMRAWGAGKMKPVICLVCNLKGNQIVVDICFAGHGSPAMPQVVCPVFGLGRSILHCSVLILPKRSANDASGIHMTKVMFADGHGTVVAYDIYFPGRDYTRG